MMFIFLFFGLWFLKKSISGSCTIKYFVLLLYWRYAVYLPFNCAIYKGVWVCLVYIFVAYDIASFNSSLVFYTLRICFV